VIVCFIRRDRDEFKNAWYQIIIFSVWLASDSEHYRVINRANRINVAAEQTK